MNIDQIDESIANLMKREPWTEKQEKFYTMLAKHVVQFRQRYKMRIQYKDDYKEINKNIKEQVWFQNLPAQRQSLICNHLKTLSVSEVQIHDAGNSKQYRYKLHVTIGDKAQLHILVVHTSRGYSIKATDGSKHGYIMHHGDHELPEYDKLKALPILSQLNKAEMICFITEIVVYYDMDNVIRQLHVGARYPVTLCELVAKIEETQACIQTEEVSSNID